MFDWRTDVKRLKRYDGKTRKQVRAMYRFNLSRLYGTVYVVKEGRNRVSVCVIDPKKRLKYLQVERDLNYIGIHLNDGKKWNTVRHYSQSASGKRKLRQTHGRKI